MRWLVPRWLTSAVLVTFCLSLSAVTGAKPSGMQRSESQNVAMIKSVEQMQAADVVSINLEGVPIQIQAASAREVSKRIFRQLTGEASGHRSMSTYPDVTLVNTSQRTIKSLMLLVHSRAEEQKSGHGVLAKDLSIYPGDTYFFASAKWPQAERVTIEQDGKYTSALRQPRLDSPKAWLPGGASDLTVVVGMVVLDDGSHWKIPDNFSW